MSISYRSPIYYFYFKISPNSYGRKSDHVSFIQVSLSLEHRFWDASLRRQGASQDAEVPLRQTGCDIPLAPPVMQLHFKNLLHRFSSFRFTTYTRTAGFRVCESTHFPSRRDTKSVCSVGISKCLFPNRTTPLSHPRSQKV